MHYGTGWERGRERGRGQVLRAILDWNLEPERTRLFHFGFIGNGHSGAVTSGQMNKAMHFSA
jgi:hypothetical protein